LTSNHAPEEAPAALLELLRLPWQGGSARGLAGLASVQVTRKGRAIWQRSSQPARQLVSLQHDRRKAQPLPAHVPDPFLQALGLQTAEGRVRASMQAKMTQASARHLPISTRR
jgi:hypothetical protein